MNDPFAAWSNDDLLLSADAADAFAARYPSFRPIFHWPALIELFNMYDRQAATLRRHSRNFGLLSVGIGVAGLIVAAIAPLLAEAIGVTLASKVLRASGIVAAVLASASAAMGYSQLLRGRAKADWLLNRFRSERLRQFQFQLILNRINEIVEALRSEDAMAAFLAAREKDLVAFSYSQLKNAAEMVHHLENDTAEDRPWIFSEWAEEPHIVEEASPELATLLDILSQQRLGVQLRFAKLKLKPGLASPATRSLLIARLSNVATVGLLLLTITTGTALATGLTPNAPLLIVLATVTGVASAAIAAMRVVADGLQLTADTERYRWYLAATKSLNRRFEAAAPANAVARLRDFERLAYQEMRRFIVSVAQSKFVI